MKNSADLGECYPPRPSASVDNTLLDLQNSSYPTQPHSIIAKLWTGNARVLWCIFSGCHPQGSSESGEELDRKNPEQFLNMEADVHVTQLTKKLLFN